MRFIVGEEFGKENGRWFVFDIRRPDTIVAQFDTNAEAKAYAEWRNDEEHDSAALDIAHQGIAWLADLHASRCRATNGCDECPDFGPCPLDRRECPLPRVYGTDWQRAARKATR